MNETNSWKNLALRTAYRLGVFELGRTVRRNKIPIVCYHRFAFSKRAAGTHSTQSFEAHLRYLKKHFTIISIARLSHLMEGKICVKNPLIVTVDDGYKDFVEVAFPLLSKYRIPATLFVTTRFVDGEMWLWPDIIRYSIRETEKMKIDIIDFESQLSLETRTDKKAALDKLVDACKQMTEAEKLTFLSEIVKVLNVQIPPSPPQEFRAASWEDLSQLDRDLFDVGSHTMTHPILSRTPSEKVEIEVAESKKRIERKLGYEVKTFAYPNGMHGDYTEEHKGILRKNGYSFAVTCNFGFNTFDSDRFELNRIVAEYDVARFVKQVSGFETLRQKSFGVVAAPRSPGKLARNQVIL